MENDKKYHILHIEDNELNIHSFQLIVKQYGSKIAVTVMSVINTKNDGSDNDIKEDQPIFFRNLQDTVGISIQDILSDNFGFSLILIDRNMQNRSTTDAIVKLLLSKDIKIPIISVSQEEEQSQICSIDWIQKSILHEQFQEKIYDTFIDKFSS